MKIEPLHKISNIFFLQAMYALMAKSEELSKSMEPTYKLHAEMYPLDCVMPYILPVRLSLSLLSLSLLSLSLSFSLSLSIYLSSLSLSFPIINIFISFSAFHCTRKCINQLVYLLLFLLPIKLVVLGSREDILLIKNTWSIWWICLLNSFVQ